MRNTDQKVETLAERAHVANYTPPPYKYIDPATDFDPERMNRDFIPLLMAPEKTAFLAIDVQNNFTEPESPVAPPDALEVVMQINRLADYCREHSIPIIWIQMTNREDGSDLGILAKYLKKLAPPESVLARGRHGWELCPELHNEPTDIYVTKPKFNAFWGSDLEAVLRGLGAESLIVTGIMTDCCVMMTVMDAFHRDFNPIIAADATGTPSAHKKEALLMMERVLSRILTTDEIIAELEALAVN